MFPSYKFYQYYQLIIEISANVIILVISIIHKSIVYKQAGYTRSLSYWNHQVKTAIQVQPDLECLNWHWEFIDKLFLCWNKFKL